MITEQEIRDLLVQAWKGVDEEESRKSHCSSDVWRDSE